MEHPRRRRRCMFYTHYSVLRTCLWLAVAGSVCTPQFSGFHWIVPQHHGGCHLLCLRGEPLATRGTHEKQSGRASEADTFRNAAILARKPLNKGLSLRPSSGASQSLDGTTCPRQGKGAKLRYFGIPTF